MPDSRLVDYIYQSLRAGHSAQQIRQSLLNSGWPGQQVDEAMSHALSGPPRPGPPAAQAYPQQARQPTPGRAGPANQRPMGVIQKFKTVLAHPNQFFERVKPEEGYEAPVKFYLFIMFIQVIALNVIFLAYFSLLSSILDIGSEMGITLILAVIFSSILSANLSVLLSIIGTFIGAALIHAIAVIFGAKRGYQNTYKALIYSTAPSVLAWPALGLLLVSPWAAIGGAALIYIWLFILQVKGLSRLHEISGARAFAIIFVPIMIVLVLVGTVLLFAIGMFTPATYTARIPTGFLTLGTPDDWDLNSNGDFSIVLQNRLPNQIQITRIEASLGPVTDSYSPATPIILGPSANYEVMSSESGLNLGPQKVGASYYVKVVIAYSRNGMQNTESGTVSGTVTT
jgi:hypothetical protein